MATLFPTLEREKTKEKTYGRLNGREESAVLTEEEKALIFNSKISDNYQKLINPEYKGKEKQESSSVADYASGEVFEPKFEHQRVTEDLFRADSIYNAPKRSFAEIPVNSAATYAEPTFAPDQYLEEIPAFVPTQEHDVLAETDLMPTATTIQYQNNLYREEQKENAENKKSYAMTTKGKVLMVVYSLVVMIILALIIVNTGVLKALETNVANKQSELNATVAQYEQVQSRIEELTSDESIIERAQSELGMVFGD